MTKNSSETQGNESGERTLAIELCRELYDRFVMGGWEPQDAHAETEARVAEFARAERRKALEEAAKQVNDQYEVILRMRHSANENMDYRSGEIFDAVGMYLSNVEAVIRALAD